MGTRQDAELEALGSVLPAPHVGGRQPEELARAERQPGQGPLLAVVLRPLQVRVVGLLDAAVVGDVLALRVDAVQLPGEGRLVRGLRISERSY